MQLAINTFFEAKIFNSTDDYMTQQDTLGWPQGVPKDSSALDSSVRVKVGGKIRTRRPLVRSWIYKTQGAALAKCLEFLQKTNRPVLLLFSRDTEHIYVLKFENGQVFTKDFFDDWTPNFCKHKQCKFEELPFETQSFMLYEYVQMANQ